MPGEDLDSAIWENIAYFRSFAMKAAGSLADEMAANGTIQVVLESDPLELASLRHRNLVFCGGRISLELVGDEISHSRILEAINKDSECAEWHGGEQ